MDPAIAAGAFGNHVNSILTMMTVLYKLLQVKWSAQERHHGLSWEICEGKVGR